MERGSKVDWGMVKSRGRIGTESRESEGIPRMGEGAPSSVDQTRAASRSGCSFNSLRASRR